MVVLLGRLTATNNTQLYFYYLSSQTTGGCAINSSEGSNQAFYSTYGQILFPGNSVVVTCTADTSPYYGFVTFNAYPQFQNPTTPESVGVFAGQVQFEYSGGNPLTMAPNYLNGYYSYTDYCSQLVPFARLTAAT